MQYQKGKIQKFETHNMKYRYQALLYPETTLNREHTDSCRRSYISDS